MSVWGGPKQPVLGVLGFMFMFGLGLLLAGFRPSLAFIIVGSFGFLFALPIVAGCSMVIWHSKIAPDMQGRASGLVSMVTGVATSLGYLLAGPLADGLNQLLLSGGLLARSMGQVVGMGAGRGIGLFYVVSGVIMILLTCIAYLYPRIRYIDVELPDAMIN